jgi:hypothetical protein
MMSSTIPSAKYSCCGSPLKFEKGRTAIEGFSGKLSAEAARVVAAASGKLVATAGPT